MKKLFFFMALVSISSLFAFGKTSETSVSVTNDETYNISLSVNPPEAGTCYGTGYNIPEGEEITVSTYAHPGWIFVYWTEDDVVVCTQSDYSFIVMSDRTLTANFVLQSYTITVSANPIEGGEVLGGGNYEYGAIATVEAVPAPGYLFHCWYKNGVLVPTSDPIYTFTVTHDCTLDAYFTSEGSGCFYTVSLLADPTEGGEVFGAGTYECGTTVTIEAIADPNYNFLYWSENDVILTVEPIFTFGVTQNLTLTAHFVGEGSGCFYTVSLLADPTEGGAVFGAGTYECGSLVIIEAIPDPNYYFVNWTWNDVIVSTDSIYMFIVTEDRTLTAHFTEEKNPILGIDEFDNIAKIYPNPTGGELRIVSGKLKINNIEIFDVYGRSLLTHTSLMSPETTIDISHLPSGMYFVKIFTEVGEVVKKVLKE
jgi:hypothetical protein